jgi:hypothetical protein
MQAVVWKPPEWVSQIQVAATEISRSVQPFLLDAARAFEATRPFLADVAKAFEAQRPAFEAWQRTMRRTEKIEAAGWLPHSTTPWAELDPVLDDPAAVGEVLERYYSEHWRGVRRKFTNRLRHRRRSEVLVQRGALGPPARPLPLGDPHSVPRDGAVSST